MKRICANSYLLQWRHANCRHYQGSCSEWAAATERFYCPLKCAPISTGSRIKCTQKRVLMISDESSNVLVVGLCCKCPRFGAGRRAYLTPLCWCQSEACLTSSADYPISPSSDNKHFASPYVTYLRQQQLLIMFKVFTILGKLRLLLLPPP